MRKGLQSAEEYAAIKRMAILAGLVALTLAPGMARANPSGPLYIGFNYTTLNADGANPTAYAFRGGYHFLNNFAVELHFLTAGSADNGRKLESGLAGFIRGEVPVGERLTFYGLLGYGSNNFSIGGITDTYASTAYGGGVTFAVTPGTAINLDYISYGNAKGLTLCSLNAGVNFAF